MAGLIERIGSLAGTELGKAANLAHHFYTERMGLHGHTGRAIVETVAEVARNHPNLVGIGAGLLVEQLLAEEKRRHDAHIAHSGDVAVAPTLDGKARNHLADPHPATKTSEHHLHFPELHSPIRLTSLRPGRVALEVFGGILLLKLASSGARMFRHKHQEEIWFAPAARVRLWSGSIGAYYLVKSLRSPKISAWRNAAVALFVTDALKPVLRMSKKQRIAARTRAKAFPVTVGAVALTASAADVPHSAGAEPAYFAPNAAPSADPWDSVGQVQSFGAPKRDPRPMPVWPSEAGRTDAPHEPVQASASLPLAASDGPFPPG